MKKDKKKCIKPNNKNKTGQNKKQNEAHNNCQNPICIKQPIKDFLKSKLITLKDKKVNQDFQNVYLITINKNTVYQGIEAIVRAGETFDFSIKEKVFILKSQQQKDTKVLHSINIDSFNNNFDNKSLLTQSSNNSLISSLFDQKIT